MHNPLVQVLLRAFGHLIGYSLGYTACKRTEGAVNTGAYTGYTTTPQGGHWKLLEASGAICSLLDASGAIWSLLVVSSGRGAAVTLAVGAITVPVFNQKGFYDYFGDKLLIISKLGRL
jgi:hypothetical protein